MKTTLDTLIEELEAGIWTPARPLGRSSTQGGEHEKAAHAPATPCPAMSAHGAVTSEVVADCRALCTTQSAAALRKTVLLESATGNAEPDLWERIAESEARFGSPHARLFPLIGQRVWTPQGVGVLLSVFADRCEIYPDGSSQTIRVLPEHVRLIQ